MGETLCGNDAWDAFVRDHRWAVLTSLRGSGQPVSSVVAYAVDGGQLVVSTPGMTFKRASIERDPRVTLTAVSNAEPFNFVSIEGNAEVTTDDLVRSTRLVFANISDTAYQEPEDLPRWLEEQSRVIIRITPSRAYGVIR